MRIDLKKMFVKLNLVVLSFISIISTLNADFKGAETLVSIEPAFVFPSNPVSEANRMLAFGYFKNGFTLQDATTTCSFESNFPVSGSIDVRGGHLYLVTDLYLDNNASLVSSGEFLSNGRRIELGESITQIPSTIVTTLKNTNLFLNRDLTLSGTVRIKGTCIIDGNGRALTMNNSARFVVAKGSTLRLRNMRFNGLSRNNIYCLNDQGALVLDDVRIAQSANFTFSQGSILFNKQVSISGPYSFAYQSKLTSTISQNSTLSLDNGLTFSYDPKRNSDSLLFFQDKTSHLTVNNSNLYATKVGLKLIRGTIDINGFTQFFADPLANHDIGIILGNDNSTEDLQLNFADGALLNHILGAFVYRNVGITSMVAKNVLSTIRMEAGTTLNLKQSIYLDYGRLQLSSSTNLDSLPGAQINGSVEVF